MRLEIVVSAIMILALCFVVASPGGLASSDECQECGSRGSVSPLSAECSECECWAWPPTPGDYCTEDMPGSKDAEYLICVYNMSGLTWASASTQINGGNADQLIISSNLYYCTDDESPDQCSYYCGNYDWVYNEDYVWVRSCWDEVTGYFRGYGSHSVNDDHWYGGVNHWTPALYCWP